MRPSRYLMALAAIFIVLFAVLLGIGKGSFSERLKPKLGLDLVGGTTLTLTAKTETGGPPSADSLEQARQIIENRVNGWASPSPRWSPRATEHIVVSVAGENDEASSRSAKTAQLRFRTVLQTTQDPPEAAPEPARAAPPNPGASASADALARRPPPRPATTPTPSASATPAPALGPRRPAPRRCPPTRPRSARPC